MLPWPLVSRMLAAPTRPCVGWDMPGERTESTASRTAYEDAFAPLVYDELRRIAHRHLRSERPGHTLSTTALVHESYLKLAEQTRAVFRDRTHFLAVASQGMRRILIDYARGHRAARRGGEHQHVTLDDAYVAAVEQGETLIALHEALERLEQLDPRQGRVVECRFFGGMTEPETALALAITERTVRRDWVKAKAWLYAELYSDGVDPQRP
jgi:RNA polymerase sigma factor (TIGR02999 family)